MFLWRNNTTSNLEIPLIRVRDYDFTCINKILEHEIVIIYLPISFKHEIVIIDLPIRFNICFGA